MFNRLMLAAAVLCACASRSGPPEPPMDPHLAAQVVVDSMLAASDPASEDGVEMWRAAHHTFERHLEPLLRSRYGDRTVAEVEYGFGLVRSKLGSVRAAESAKVLGERVAALSADLPSLQPQS